MVFFPLEAPPLSFATAKARSVAASGSKFALIGMRLFAANLRRRQVRARHKNNVARLFAKGRQSLTFSALNKINVAKEARLRIGRWDTERRRKSRSEEGSRLPRAFSEGLCENSVSDSVIKVFCQAFFQKSRVLPIREYIPHTNVDNVYIHLIIKNLKKRR